jgi:transposase
MVELDVDVVQGEGEGPCISEPNTRPGEAGTAIEDGSPRGKARPRPSGQKAIARYRLKRPQRPHLRVKLELPLAAGVKVPTFDGHLNESNADLRRCSMEYKPRRKLTREFIMEAVRQTALSEKPKAQVARELGVRVGQLRTWRLEFEKEAVTGIAKPDRSTADDLEQLRRENAKLKMEIEI